MGFGGFEVNSKHSDEWYPAVGKFIVNFGSIELLSNVWISALSKEPVLNEVAQSLELPKRIGIIRRLIEERSLSAKLAKKARRAWAEVEEMSELRNTIAHSPAAFGWHGKETNDRPHFLGAFRIRKLSSGKPLKFPQVTQRELGCAIDKAAKLALQLHETLNAACVELKLT